MKKYKRFFAIGLSFLLILGIVTSQSTTTYAAKYKVSTAKLALNKSKLTLTVGNSTRLKVTTNNTSSKVRWISKTKSIIAVSKSGNVRAKKAGTGLVKIVAGKYKAYCKVTVKSASTIASKVTISNTNKKVTANITKYQTQIKQIVKYTNAYRTKKGLKALKLSANLTYTASYRSYEMANADALSHTRPDGSTVFTLANSLGISYSSMGENIACYQPTSKTVVNAWYNSAGHRANMLNASYTKIGVGVAKTSDGFYYWTQIFTN